jgi:hypothetical protein
VGGGLLNTTSDGYDEMIMDGSNHNEKSDIAWPGFGSDSDQVGDNEDEDDEDASGEEFSQEFQDGAVD